MLIKNVLIVLPVIFSCGFANAGVKSEKEIHSEVLVNQCSTMQLKLIDIESRLRAYLEPEFDRVKSTEILAAETYNYLIGDIDSDLPSEIHEYRKLLTKYNSMCPQPAIESPRATFSLQDFILDYDAYTKWIKSDHVGDPELKVCGQLYKTKSNLINQIYNLGKVDIGNQQNKLQNSLISYKHVLDRDMKKHQCWKFDINEFVNFYLQD